MSKQNVGKKVKGPGGHAAVQAAKAERSTTNARRRRQRDRRAHARLFEFMAGWQ